MPSSIPIGGYRVERLLEKTVISDVFLAHADSGSPVYVKRPHADRISSGETEHRRRFRREAQVLGTIDHANAVRVLEVDEDAGQPFPGMEYIEGRSLKAVVRGGSRRRATSTRTAATPPCSIGGDASTEDLGRAIVDAL